MLIVTVLSFAFQISGALILLGWYGAKVDRIIKEKSIAQHTGLILDGSLEEIKAKIKREDIQRTANDVYKTLTAIVDIIIGYTCAIFAEASETPKCKIFLLVCVATAIIIVLESAIIKIVVEKKYRDDITADEKDLQIPAGTVAYELESDERD